MISDILGGQILRRGAAAGITGTDKEKRLHRRCSLSSRRSAQPPAGDRDAVQEAALAMIIVDCEMPGRAVVPESERAFPPLEAAGEFGPHRVAVEKVEQRAGFFLGPAVKAHGKPRIDVKRLA